MDNLIFKTKFLGSTVEVFNNRIEYSLFFQKVIIPLKQIASIDTAIPGTQKIVVETTGGKKHSMIVRLRDKKKLTEIINQMMYAE